MPELLKLRLMFMGITIVGKIDKGAGKCSKVIHLVLGCSEGLRSYFKIKVKRPMAYFKVKTQLLVHIT